MTSDATSTVSVHTTSPPPAYDGPAAIVPEKKRPVSDSDSELALTCEHGHDTRLGPARFGATIALMPWSMLFLHCNKNRTCRRCGEKVRRKGCCPFGSEFEQAA